MIIPSVRRAQIRVSSPGIPASDTNQRQIRNIRNINSNNHILEYTTNDNIELCWTIIMDIIITIIIIIIIIIHVIRNISQIRS